MRRMLFLPVTAVMLLTGFSGEADSSSWWAEAPAALELIYHPKVVTPEDFAVSVVVKNTQQLRSLEFSVDGGSTWEPLDYLPGLDFQIGPAGVSASFEFSLEAGYLAQVFSAPLKSSGNIRSVLLRGVTAAGQRTAPRALALLYQKAS